MEVAIAGGHGKIGMLLGRLLVERGDSALGLIRKSEQEDDLRAAGIEPVLVDLEGGADADVAAAVRGADAVVFAAGAGPGSSIERKWTMDFGGAVKLIEACKAEGITRYAIVSAMGATDPPAESDDVFSEYLRAKAAADAALRESGLAYTVVRPGGLTDDAPTGAVKLGDRLDRGQVSRADVAAVLVAVLDAEHAIGAEFDLLAGETPIADAIAAL
jgi:nucleoside-diphosphate-sugar epimerase